MFRFAFGSPTRRTGFTLIELLIVIAIILILIAIALPNFLEAQIRAKITKAKGCLQTYRTAQEAYFTDFNQYAPDVDGGERAWNLNPPIEWEQVWRLAGVNCDGSEMCTYRVLTTPIAYLKEFCYEPFIGDRDESVRGKDVSFFEYGSYLSSGSGPKNPQENYTSGLRFGLQYVMISLGPDLAYNYDYQAGWTSLGLRNYFGPSPAFSPTNGSRSVGDIILSNRGHEG
jgi:prepilin-type N-terminal cleavage/methylation domain-containing protein